MASLGASLLVAGLRFGLYCAENGLRWTRSWIDRSFAPGVVACPDFLCGCASTLRTSLSLSVLTEVMVPVCHSRRGVFFSFRSTTSPTVAFLCGHCHFSLFVPIW